MANNFCSDVNNCLNDKKHQKQLKHLKVGNFSANFNNYKKPYIIIALCIFICSLIVLKQTRKEKCKKENSWLKILGQSSIILLSSLLAGAIIFIPAVFPILMDTWYNVLPKLGEKTGIIGLCFFMILVSTIPFIIFFLN